MSDLTGAVPEFDRIRMGDPLATEDAIRLLWGLQFDPSQQTRAVLGKDTPPTDVLVFTHTVNSDGVVLSWENPDDPTPRWYDIRLGTLWGTADRVAVTSATQFNLGPVASGTYLIKALNRNGAESPNAASTVVTIPALGTISVTATVIDNNVLLKWTAPTSLFAIDYYTVKKGGTVIGTIKGTFTAIYEQASGTFTYSITPVDIGGNSGTPATVDAIVNTPPDYVLTGTVADDQSGTKVNVYLDGTSLIGPVYTSETYQAHFTKGPWSTWQDVISAGYSYWLQPAESTGTYTKTFDFGTIYTNVGVQLDWSETIIAGSVAVTTTIAVSDDNISYDTPVAGTSRFCDSVRYARMVMTYTPTSSGIVSVDGISASLSVKLAIDAGEILADKTDTYGTTVTFNKAFKDVESITLTVDSTAEGILAIYDFTDVPNPTDFAVFAYDSTGNRVDYYVSWKARGIV